MPQAPAILFLRFLAISSVVAVVSCAQGNRIAKKQPIQPAAAVGTKEFEKAMATAVKMPWVAGNDIQTLVNGDEIFPSMLTAIKSAKKTVTFETYAWVRGTIAN